ncbi:hypothetical protein [Fictibacillus fluitans]|uniref:Uncharacterized protein n=1 Tax=Fictibacillus fluitans TaxID=3058422 RepID=A0ABT8HX98_9BACL|nr:hypothetical protein [Fictibacillus sp. NE201]MDN4525334.1 hypothetical protein [Fictibacillus sp. NE201]
MKSNDRFIFSFAWWFIILGLFTFFKLVQLDPNYIAAVSLMGFCFTMAEITNIDDATHRLINSVFIVEQKFQRFNKFMDIYLKNISALFYFAGFGFFIFIPVIPLNEKELMIVENFNNSAAIYSIGGVLIALLIKSRGESKTNQNVKIILKNLAFYKEEYEKTQKKYDDLLNVIKPQLDLEKEIIKQKEKDDRCNHVTKPSVTLVNGDGLE